jgi:hypothetical protein
MGEDKFRNKHAKRDRESALREQRRRERDERKRAAKQQQKGQPPG